MDFLLQDMLHAPFWIAVLQIVGVNVVLSGDNAVVIALACMRLPPRQRLWGMILGAAVAVLLRVGFTVVVAQAMTYPYLRLVGALLLFWVAIKLVYEDNNDEERVESAENLWRAVRIVAIADIVMSLDNVIAIAASAEAAAVRVNAEFADQLKTTLIVFGLATSVPLIIAGSAILMSLLERFRILVWAGGAMLGYVAGDILVTDPAVVGWIGKAAHAWHPWTGPIGAMLVVGTGLVMAWMARGLSREDVLAGLFLPIWLVGEVVISYLMPDDAVAARWVMRAAMSAVLCVAYFFLRTNRSARSGEV